MKAVFGLGNPGREYRQTRHNLGFLVIERYLERQRAQPCFSGFLNRVRLRGRRLDQALVYRVKDDLLLVKPLTYMNRSGLAVKEIVRRFGLRLEDCLVVCDDLALPWGRLRLRAKGGAGSHRGLASISAELGTEEIPRLRIGIGREGLQGDLTSYVLGRFTPEELAQLEPVLERVAGAIDLFYEQSIERLMGEINRTET